MHQRLPILVIAVLLLGAAPIVIAEEGTEEATRTVEDVLASLPEPGPEQAFLFDGAMVSGGQTIGSVVVAAEPTADGERMLWALRETVAMEGMLEIEIKVQVTRDLRPVRGETIVRKPDEVEARVAWEARDDRCHCIATRGASESTEFEIPLPDQTLYGTASTVLFLRSVLEEPGSYSIPTFDLKGIQPTNDVPVRSMKLRVEGRGEWRGRPAHRATQTAARQPSVTYAFDPDTRELLGMETGDDDASMVIVPKDAAPDTAPFDFTQPADRPAVAALRCQFALSVQDAELLDDVMHWPSAYEALGGAGLGVSEPAYREMVLDSVRSVEGNDIPRTTFERLLPALLASAVVTTEGDDRATVTFKQAGTVYRVGRFDGVWKVLGLPD